MGVITAGASLGLAYLLDLVVRRILGVGLLKTTMIGPIILLLIGVIAPMNYLIIAGIVIGAMFLNATIGWFILRSYQTNRHAKGQFVSLNHAEGIMMAWPILGALFLVEMILGMIGRALVFLVCGTYRILGFLTFSPDRFHRIALKAIVNDRVVDMVSGMTYPDK